MAIWKKHACRSKHSGLVIIQCQSCTGLLIGNSCFDHHQSSCEKSTKAGNQWTPANYAAVNKHNQNDSFLCKWLDCSKCKLQQDLANSKTSSYLGRQIRLIPLCRISYLLISKHIVKHRLFQVSKFFKLDAETISTIVDFVT